MDTSRCLAGISGQYDDYFLIVNTHLTCARGIALLQSIMNTCRVSDGRLWWYFTLYEDAMHRIDNSCWNNYFDKTSYAIPAAPATILFADDLSILLKLNSIGYSMSVSYIDVRKYDITCGLINKFPQRLEALFHTLIQLKVSGWWFYNDGSRQIFKVANTQYLISQPLVN